MTIEQEAKKYGLSRQTYTNRVKTWIKVNVNGRDALVNPNQIMYLKEDVHEPNNN